MTRRSTTTKRLAAERFPFTVDVPVPLDGLGTRVNDMVTWCEDRGCAYASHGHRQRRPGDVPLDAVRFYFLTEGDAAAFRVEFAILAG